MTNLPEKIIITEDNITLDSPEAALFYGLMRFWEIPCERADRRQAVQVFGDEWYCPGFYLPGEELWVEVKTLEDDKDRIRWEAWRKAGAGRKLAVLRREELDMIREASRDSMVIARLRLIENGCLHDH
jgi:hypothetical protein